MAYTKEPRVDEYIDALPDWQRGVCREVRDLIHAAAPEIIETIKYRGRPYFVLDGNVAALMGTKDHVNVFLYDPTVSDPEGIITHGHGNATGRQIAIYQGNALNTRAFETLIEEIVANNRAGGWRRRSRPDS
ncbi:MAG: DUF1801 domain-containing protein [Candidatus Nanopelagicales bacterium]